MVLPRTFLHKKHLLLNRELSWLEFNRRVLEEALDSRHPLLERLKFLSIFSTNLDEFFMVRVSGLKEALEAGVESSPDGMKTAEQLSEISTRLRPLLAQQMRSLQTEIFPGLASSGIVVKPFRELNKRERKTAADYFAEKVFPILTPQAVDTGHPFPYISNLSVNLGVVVGPANMKKSLKPALGLAGVRFARIKLPPSVPRLIPVDEKGSRFKRNNSIASVNSRRQNSFRDLRAPNEWAEIGARKGILQAHSCDK